MKKKCCSCDWCKELQDKYNREYYICMDCDSPAFLEETGICGGCEIEGGDSNDE